MENKNEDIVKVLNTLVEINNDRIEGYKKASDETNEADLKSLFATMSDQSRTFKQQLSDEIIRLGGEPTDSTTASGKVYRVWMDIRAALATNDRKAVLANCEFGEDAAVETYDKALEDEDLKRSFDVALVQKQRSELKQSHDKIRTLRDSVSI